MARNIDKKILITDGCSWTAGDIVDPKLFADDLKYSMHIDNDQYRLPRVWPHKLGNLLNIKVDNISNAGSSNDGIIRRTLSHIPAVLEKHKPEDITVIIGFTSPERKDFFFSDGEQENHWDTLYPSELGTFHLKQKYKKQFYNLYGRYYWNEQEYLSRYMISIITLHSYLKANNIKHYFFDAFYEPRDACLNPDVHAVFESISLNKALKFKYKDWIDKKITFKKLHIRGLYETYFKIYDEVFIKKTMIEKMKEYLTEDQIKDHDSRMKVFDETYHPTEFSHTVWAEYLFNNIKNV